MSEMTAEQLADALEQFAADPDSPCYGSDVVPALGEAVTMLRNTIGHQEVLDEAAKDVVRLQAEIERLRAALRTIVKRAEGGTGAAVMVTPHTLAAIAKGALGDE